MSEWTKLESVNQKKNLKGEFYFIIFYFIFLKEHLLQNIPGLNLSG